MRTPTLLLPFVLALPLAAQNSLQHYDGTPEAASRGSLSPSSAKAVLQRIPADQACGATKLREVAFVVQDQNATTLEAYDLQIRRNDASGPAVGRPDMSLAGLIASTGLTVVAFPGTGVSALGITVTFATPVALPPLASGANGDWYLALAFPAAPGYPQDAISCQASGVYFGYSGEQMNPVAVGYTGVRFTAGLGWENDTATATFPTLDPANVAWSIAGRYAEDTLQPYAHNPGAFQGTGSGKNPNYGYAGLWPYMGRPLYGPDGIGLRLLSAQPVGTPCVLLVSALRGAVPVPLPPGLGAPGSPDIHIDLAGFVAIGPVTTTAPPTGEPATSQAVFGPFPGSAALGGAGSLYWQAATVSGGLVKLSTMCRNKL